MRSEALVSRPGPKTDLTPELIKMIAGYVNAGASIATAAQAAGIKPDTIKKWMARGRQGKAPYDALVAAVEQARAMHSVAMQMVITSAAKRGDWRAAAYDQQRRHAQQIERARRKMPDSLAEEERVICVYPVPMPEGARIEDLQLVEGHAIDTTGESVGENTITVSYEDHDD